jgi:hypothetical protein
MVFRLRARHRGRSRPERSLRPSLQDLEVRLAPAGAGSPVGFTPPQIRAAYGINQVMFGATEGNGAGQTIAIICAYSDSALVDTTNSNYATSDLAEFDQEFDLSDPPSFKILNEYGTDIGGSNAIPRPATDPTGLWEDTEALDVEWAHAIAPDAAIILIECNSSSATDMFTGVTTAESLPGVSVVSMNQTSGQTPSLSLVDDAFTTPPGHQGVTFVAPAGDSGSPGWFPAYSSNVVAVGGTSLTLNPLDIAAPYQSEQAWSDTGGGGGTSEFGTEPAFQEGVQQTGFRTIPDVAFDADPSTGVSVYDSYNYGTSTPWVEAGGTSLSAACWAGLIAIADQGRVAAGGTTLDGPSQTLPALYSLPTGDFHDITSGGNGTYNAGPGYDLVSGLGAPEANVLVSDLASYELGSQLVVSAQPPSSVTAGTQFGFTVTALDSSGDVETTFDGSVTVTFGSNPGGGPLRGTLTATATSGVAEFSDLSINTAATGYTLEATGVGMTAATTTFINVTPGPAAELAVTTQPPAAVAINSGFGLAIAAEDIYGNVVTSYSGNVTVVLANNPGGGALLGTTTIAAVGGIASFTGLAINMPSTDVTLQATSSGLVSTTTGSVDVTPPATALVVTAQPPFTVIAGSSFGLTVDVVDSQDDVVPSFNGNVTVALASGPAGTTLGGRLRVTAVSGVATFAGLSLDEVGAYTFTITSGLLSDAITESVSVTPGPVAQLVVTTPPPLTTTAGSPFGLAVSAEDTYGNVETSFYGNITIALVGATVALSGTLTATASAGVATFAGLVLDTAGANYSLQASENGLTTTASPMSVTSAPATRLVVTIPPPGTMIAGSAFGLTVSAEDAYGNLATTFDDNVSVALVAAPDGSALGGTTIVTAAQGVATFAGLTLDTVGTDYSLKIESGSLTATLSGINVNPGPAAELAVTSEPPLSMAAGTSFGLTVSVEDAFGNRATTFTGDVTVAIAASPGGGVLAGTTTITASQGIATFSGLSLDTAGSGYTLEATGNGLTATTSRAFSITPGPAARLAVTTPPPGTVAAGSSFGLIVSAQDAFGNLATSWSGSVTIALASEPGTGVLDGTTTVAATNGILVFTGLVLDTAGNGYTFQVKSTGLSSATTGPTNVTPTATQLEVTSQPPTSVVAGTGFGLTISVADAAGNLVTSFNGNVTVALATNPGGGELSGALTTTAVNGVAAFTGLSINVASPGYTLFATSIGLTSATTASINVEVGPVPHLAIFDNPGPFTVGSPFQATVDVENSLGVTETDFSGDVTLSLARNPTGATLGGNLTMPALNGQATFYGLTLNLAGAGYTILATSNGYVAATTSQITVVDPPATQLLVTVQPPARVAADGAFGLTVEAVDAAGNVATSFDGTVTVALAGKPAGGKLHGTLTVTAISGVATFSGLSSTKARRGDTLRLTASGLTPTSTSAFDVTATRARRLTASAHRAQSKASTVRTKLAGRAL